jgi:predicted nucleic acid-binding protein
VNVLIALLDPGHIQHDLAHEWFAAQGKQSWATCPLIENGVLRIIGHALLSEFTRYAIGCSALEGWLAGIIRTRVLAG